MVFKALLIMLCTVAAIPAQEKIDTSFSSARLGRRMQAEQDKGSVPLTRRRLVAKRPVETTSVMPITEAVVIEITETPRLVVSSEAPIEDPQKPTEQPTPAVARRPVNRKRINAIPRRRTTTTASPISQLDQDPVIFERKTAMPVAPRRKATITASPIPILDEEEAAFDPLPVNRQQTSTGNVFGKTEGRTRKQQQQLLQTVRQYSFQGVDGTYTYGYETADGSFKEETKQPDCTIIGKYGYREADGTKREFSYHTGLPCKTFP